VVSGLVSQKFSLRKIFPNKKNPPTEIDGKIFV